MLWSLLVLPSPAASLAFVGATVYPVSGPPIEDGVVLVEADKIVAVGSRASVPVPPGAEVHDVSGKVIVPGLVDTHSHIGAAMGPAELNERSGPLQPQISAIDTLDATHPSFQIAQAGGLTTVNVMPGSGNLIGGQTAYLKLRDASSVDEMLVCSGRRDKGAICGGLKMANGTNPQGDPNNPRMTRMGAAAAVRQAFLDARKHRDGGSDGKKKKKKKKPSSPGPVDLGKDPLVEVLDGKRVVHFHTHRSDDIDTALALGKEFGFVPVLHHVTEGWKQLDAIAAAGAPCSVIVVDSPGGKEEALEIRLETAAMLVQRGVKVAIHTDDPITDSRLLLRSAALAIRGGLSEEAALAALTLRGAEMLGLEARVGSLAPGKDADLVVLSGPPFSIWTHVEQTWVEGERVFDRSDPADRRYATGGFDRPREYPGGEP
jgi:imidazolonepropionase-like amidohydrolase